MKSSMRVLLLAAGLALANAAGHLGNGQTGAIFVGRTLTQETDVTEENLATLAAWAKKEAAFTSSSYFFQTGNNPKVVHGFSIYTSEEDLKKADELHGDVVPAGTITAEYTFDDAENFDLSDATKAILKKWGVADDFNVGPAGGWVLKKDITQADLVSEGGKADDAVLSLWLAITASDTCNGCTDNTDEGTCDAANAPGTCEKALVSEAACNDDDSGVAGTGEATNADCGWDDTDGDAVQTNCAQDCYFHAAVSSDEDCAARIAAGEEEGAVAGTKDDCLAVTADAAEGDGACTWTEPKVCTWITQAEGEVLVQEGLDAMVHVVADNNPGTVSYAGYKSGPHRWELREIYSNSKNFVCHLGNCDTGFEGDFATAIGKVPGAYWSGYIITAPGSGEDNAGLSKTAYDILSGFPWPVAKAHGNLLNRDNFPAGGEESGSGDETSPAAVATTLLSGAVALVALLL